MSEENKNNIKSNIQKALAIFIVSLLMIVISIMSYYKSEPSETLKKSPHKPPAALSVPEKLPAIHNLPAQPAPPPPEKEPAVNHELSPKTTTPMLTPDQSEKPLKAPQKKPAKQGNDEIFVF